MIHDCEFKIRKWGIECRCGQYVDMGRPGTQAEAEWEEAARREGREIMEKQEEQSQ